MKKIKVFTKNANEGGYEVLSKEEMIRIIFKILYDKEIENEEIEAAYKELKEKWCWILN